LVWPSAASLAMCVSWAVSWLTVLIVPLRTVSPVADDVYSMRFAWLTNGKVPPSGLKPHDDLLADFPYLGPPNTPSPAKTSS
jgi:hypothetical protein